LDINEVGVPIEIAKRLTVPKRVTFWNIDKFIRYNDPVTGKDRELSIKNPTDLPLIKQYYKLLDFIKQGEAEYSKVLVEGNPALRENAEKQKIRTHAIKVSSGSGETGGSIGLSVIKKLSDQAPKQKDIGKMSIDELRQYIAEQTRITGAR